MGGEERVEVCLLFECGGREGDGRRDSGGRVIGNVCCLHEITTWNSFLCLFFESQNVCECMMYVTSLMCIMYIMYIMYVMLLMYIYTSNVCKVLTVNII